MFSCCNRFGIHCARKAKYPQKVDAVLRTVAILVLFFHPYHLRGSTLENLEHIVVFSCRNSCPFLWIVHIYLAINN